MIELSFPWNVNEAIAAEQQAFNRGCRLPFRILLYSMSAFFGAGLLVLFIFSVWKEGLNPGVSAPAIFLFWIFGPNLPFLRRWRIRRLWPKIAQTQMDCLISDDSLQVSSGSSLSLSVGWRSVHEVARSPQGFLVVVSAPPHSKFPSYLWLPMHAFRPEDRSAFEGLAIQRARVVDIE